MGTVFFWVYGVGQLINGYVGDRVSARFYVFFGLFVTALVNIAFGFAASLGAMIILWALNGYFQSMLWGPIVKTLSYWFTHEGRSWTAIAISTSIVAGYLFAWGIAGNIVTVGGWRWAFRVPGATILVFSLIWLVFIRAHPEEVDLTSPNTEHPKNTVGQRSQAGVSLAAVLSKTRIWYLAIACFTQGIVKDGIGLWGPTLLMETHGLDLRATVSLILLIPVASFGGMMFAGWLSKRLKNQAKKAAIVLFSAGLAMICCLLFFGESSRAAGIAFLSLSSAMMNGSNTLLLAVIPLNYTKYGKVSSVAGFLDFISYLAAGSGAAFTGLIVDLKNWRWVLAFWGLSIGIGIVSLSISVMRDRSVRVEVFD